MKPILIIKAGSTFPSIKESRGDFEDWIIAGMEIEREKFLIRDVSSGASLPDYEKISGIVITGSHANVTEHHDWSERTAAWLPGAVQRRIPLLGICYGHQLLAYALGGEVDDNPNGVEFGTANVHLHETAEKDFLFSDLPPQVPFQVSHTQSVLKLPPTARLLASNSMEPHHAFVIDDCAWGIQFHPEFDADIVKRYIEILRDYLQSKGLKPDELIEKSFDTPFGEVFLKRFAEIVTGMNK
jgi:GMP synthase (glutamine-hydrolysing)